MVDLDWAGLLDFASQAAISKPRFHVFDTNPTFIKYGLNPQEEAMKAGDIDLATESEFLYGELSFSRLCPSEVETKAARGLSLCIL